MNIIVFKRDGTWCHRPDSSLNHIFLDYYRPEFVQRSEVVPVVYTRIVKAGKCIPLRFAQRYFGEYALGCTINDTTPGVSEPMASSLDFTSVLGMDFFPAIGLTDSRLSLEINGTETCAVSSATLSGEFYKAISAISQRSTIRLGDIVALEIGPAREIVPGDTISLCRDGEKQTIKIL